MKPLVCLTLLLLTSCNLRRGLDTDVCAGPAAFSARLASLGDAVAVFRHDELVGSAGTPCGLATDRAACDAAFARLKPVEPRHMREHGPGPLAIIVTRKDSVLRLDSSSTWAELSGLPAATRAQVWVEFKRRLGVLCGGSNVSEGPDGVRVLVSSHDGCFGGSDQLLLVSPDGAIETLREKSYPQTCVG